MKQNLSLRILLSVAILVLPSSCSTKRSHPDAIRIRWAHDPETLDPLLLPNQTAIEANNLLHLSLLQVDYSTESFAPALAQNLPVVRLVGDSMMTLAYTLRPAAAWDDGHPILATDVEFTLKLLFCPGLPNEMARNQYCFIRALRMDAQTPRSFTLVCQGQALENVHNTGDFFILPEASLDPAGLLRHFSLAELQQWPATAPPNAALQAIARRYQAAVAAQGPTQLPGCGPYRLVSWEKDRYLRFRRKPQWWGDQVRPTPFVLQVRPQQLDYLIIPDAATATLALRQGTIDVFPLMPAREFARLRASPKASAALQFYSTPTYDVVTAGFNTRRPALADTLTRQALSRCFDAASLLEATQLGGGQRTASIICPCDQANYNNSLAPLPYDLGAAAALLRQAGWRQAGGAATAWFRPDARGRRQPLRLLVRYRSDEVMFTTVALQFRAAAAALGIPVELRPTEGGAFSTALREGDFDVWVRTLKGNPFMFNFMPLLHTKGIGMANTMQFSQPTSDQLIEAIAAANSKTERARLLRQFQALLQREVPLVPLFFLPNRLVASRSLGNLRISKLKPGYAPMAVERHAARSPLAP